MKQTPRPTPKARTQKTPRRNYAKTEREPDPVQVFCRVRPLSSEELDSCIEVISNTVVQLVPPIVSGA